MKVFGSASINYTDFAEITPGFGEKLEFRLILM